MTKKTTKKAATKAEPKAPTFDSTKPFAKVYGRTRACYYQGGTYFDGAHRALSSEDAAKDPRDK